MPWKEVSTVSSRIEFVKLAQDNRLTMRELCLRFDISPKTGYKWLKRYESEGDDGLSDRSRRPRESPTKTSKAIERRILVLRAKHPAWGGRKLRRRLLDLGNRDVPSPSTITAILKRHGRLDEQISQQHTAFKRFEYPHPNDLWQMDFKGHFQLGRVRCHPLTVLDDHSRFSLGLRACADEQRLTVQDGLTRIFKCYGLPHCILADNGSSWSGRESRDLTRIDVWFMQLGIRFIHGRPYHPQTQGKEERFHRTLQAEVLQSNTFRDFDQCQKAFDAWRKIYNFERPHEALGLDVPGTRYRPSERPFPRRLPLPEYGVADAVRKVYDGGYISFKNKEVKVGKALLGHVVAVRQSSKNAQYGVYFYSHWIRDIDLKKGHKSRRKNNNRRRT